MWLFTLACAPHASARPCACHFSTGCKLLRAGTAQVTCASAHHIQNPDSSVMQPCNSQPSVTQSCNSRPSVTQPCYSRSSVTQPCYSRSSVTQPCYSRSSVTHPCYSWSYAPLLYHAVIATQPCSRGVVSHAAVQPWSRKSCSRAAVES